MLGRITEEPERVHTDYLLSYAHLEDKVFLFLIHPEEVIQREKAQKREIVEELFRQMHGKDDNPLCEQRLHKRDFLEQLNASYLFVYEHYKQDFKNQVYLSNFSGEKDASLLEKAQATLRVTLLRDFEQLPFPELFGLCCRQEVTSKKSPFSKRSRGLLGRLTPQLTLPLKMID